MSAPNAEILNKVVAVIESMIADWDMDLDAPLGAGTRMMEDLGFESIDVMQFIVSIEQAFKRKGLPFEKLFLQDGDYVEEMSLGQVASFLTENL